MAGVNKVIVMGEIVKSPEFTYMEKGKSICRFIIRTVSKKHHNGAERVDLHRCTASGSPAVMISQYVKPYQYLYIEGELRYGSFERNGEQIFTSDILVSNFSFVGSKKQSHNQPQIDISSGDATNMILSGFRDLDRMLGGLRRGELIIIGARPSMGKTALAIQLVFNSQKANNNLISTFFVSAEMSKEQLLMRMISSGSGIDSSRLRNVKLSSYEWLLTEKWREYIANLPIYVSDIADISMSEIITKARQLKQEKNINLVVIDYLQLINSDSEINRSYELGAMTMALKSLSKELDVVVIALSQLSRATEHRPDKRPILSDLRESRRIEEIADSVFLIYRDEVYNKEENNPNKGKAEIIIAKNKNGWAGSVRMEFIGHCTRFEDEIQSSNLVETRSGDM